MNMNIFCYKYTKDVLESKKPTFFQSFMCFQQGFVAYFITAALIGSTKKTLGLQPETWGACK